jgi:lysine-N-methylase
MNKGFTMKRKFQVLKPAYYTKFSCIGSACEDNCCKDWDIVIDKKTYLLYKQVKDPAFAQKLPERVRRVRGAKASDIAYAQFIMDEKRVCKFQTEEKLCEIQKTLGEKYMCLTCMVYPRKISGVLPNLMELSLSMSCPEVVRMALLHPEPITFETSEEEFDRSDVLMRLVPFRPKKTGDNAVYAEHAWIIREGMIDVLQCRDLSLANRIFAVGMMLDKITAAGKEGKAESIPSLVNAFTQAARHGDFAQSQAHFVDNEAMQTTMNSTLVNTILMHFAKKADSAKAFHVFLLKVLTIGAMKRLSTNDVETHNMINSYTAACVAKHWPGFLEKYEYVLENYFVNYVFSAVMPFAYQGEMDPYHHFIILAEQYALMRTLLCGIAGKDGEINEELLTRVITCVSNLSQHSYQALHIEQQYSNAECDSLAHISFLLRQ